jgi:hypothetical protein
VVRAYREATLATNSQADLEGAGVVDGACLRIAGIVDSAYTDRAAYQDTAYTVPNVSNLSMSHLKI